MNRAEQNAQLLAELDDLELRRVVMLVNGRKELVTLIDRRQHNQQPKCDDRTSNDQAGGKP